MNKLFKDIRHSDFNAVRATISKNIKAVNEVYTGKAPKKDIGQSPLQVAINPEVVPPHSVCMPVLHDAIIGAFSALCYKQYMQSEKYVNLIKILLEYGANPNRKTSSEILPIGMAVNQADFILSRKSAYPDIQEITQKRLLEILDLLIEYGADKKEWLDQDFWGVSNKVHYFEEKQYGTNNIDIREPIRIVLEGYFH